MMNQQLRKYQEDFRDKPGKQSVLKVTRLQKCAKIFEIDFISSCRVSGVQGLSGSGIYASGNLFGSRLQSEEEKRIHLQWLHRTYSWWNKS